MSTCAKTVPAMDVRNLLPADALKVLLEMTEGWGYPLQHYASDSGVELKRTGAIVRAFAALGWAEHHRFFSEDDNLIRGSGYSLTQLGASIRRSIFFSEASA